MSLWTATDAAAATGGAATTGWSATGVSIDTRSLQSGDLFVALRDVRDGHDFVGTAMEKGAAAALVTHRPEGVAEDAPLLIVSDVLKALEALGAAARARTNAKVIGVTGSVGKTSTKEMLRTVLGLQGKTHAAEASYNNHWGVPLTLARMPANTDYAVVEIGMSNPGEIAPLAKMAKPHVGMVTTVAAAHLAAFGALEGIAHEKGSILEGVLPGGVAVLNGDIETANILAGYANDQTVKWFGHDPTFDWQIKDVRIAADATIIQARGGGHNYLLKLSAPGRHFAMNAVGVLAAVEALGADPAMAARDMAQWAPPSGRGQREVIQLDEAVETSRFDLIDDAFNANPTSLAAALEVLAATTPIDDIGRIRKGRRVAILGDMLELGPTEIEDHRAMHLNDHLQVADVVHCSGVLMRHLWEALPDERRGLCVDNADQLADQANRLVDAGDVVLVKGSKGSQVSRVVDAIRKLGHRSAHASTKFPAK
ncbi:MAG: UDP-N-acetylmuramoyl-tripeptide--D-alanyl-D-alanine ligase [Pseudomonadota bacterium]